MTPITSRPDVIGTPSQDSVGAAPSGKMAPAATASARVSRRSWRPDLTTTDVRPSPTSLGGTSSRFPSSNQYGKWMMFAERSTRAMNMSRACLAKIWRTRSPTSSTMAANSSSAARAPPISLMSASSAARWSVSASSRFVSSKRRAFASATPMLDATVDTSRSSASVKASGLSLPRTMTPMTSPPAGIGTPSHDSESSPPPVADDRSVGVLLGEVAVPARSVAVDDDRRQSLPELDRIGMDPLALVGVVGERDEAGRLVVQGNEHVLGLGREDGEKAIAHDIDDGVEVELRRQGRPDLVDECQLGGPLVRLGQQALGLIEQSRVLERHAHARCERRQETLIALRERVGLQTLEADDADDSLAGRDGHAQPGLRVRASDLHRAGSRLLCDRPQAQRSTAPDDLRRDARSQRIRSPLEALALVDVVRPRDACSWPRRRWR